MKILSLFFISLASFGAALPSALAYMDTIRHGYPQCTSCHVSPGGDGPLHPDGRKFSEDFQATWPRTEEGSPAQRHADPTHPWLVGGNLRYLYYYFKTEKTQDLKAGPMQIDGELAWRSPMLTLNASLGWEFPAFSRVSQQRAVSRRHYLLYSPTKQPWLLRLGRFAAQYGLILEDHTSLTRSPLALGINEESYNLEFSFSLSRRADLFLTLQGPHPDKADYDQDIGPIVTLRWNLREKQQLGLSALTTKSANRERVFGGWHWFMTLDPRWMAFFEWDYTSEKSVHDGHQRFGWTLLARAELLLTKGLFTNLGYETRREFGENEAAPKDYWRTEVRWFPRPHWDLSATYKQLRTPNFAPTEFFYFNLHYYF